MKKTFKKNILKNNKYNFKTELLLSALALLVGFGTTACKKDNVKPKKNNNTENPVKPVDPVNPVNPVNPPVVPPKSSEEILLNLEKQFRITVKSLKPLGLYNDFMDMVNQGDTNFSFKTFYDSVVGNVYFIDQKKGEESLRISNATLDQISLGYKKAAYSAQKAIREIEATKEQIEAIDEIVKACENYLGEYNKQNANSR